MKLRFALPHLLLLATLVCPGTLSAHPTGNLIRVGDHVLWSYVDPLDDPDHHACVMMWSPGKAPRVVIRSEFPASDYMLAAKGSEIYVLERRYRAESNHFETRLLQLQIGGEPTVHWPWFRDPWRVGEGGFTMRDENTLIFARFPGVLILERGGTPEPHLSFDQAITRLREVAGGDLLLLGEGSVILASASGQVLRRWNSLTDTDVPDAPLDRNSLFDADFQNGVLLLAYWGGREFRSIGPGNTRQKLLALDAPWAPHWVAFYRDTPLLFASSITMDGTNPKPRLVQYGGDTAPKLIWGVL